MALTDVQAMDVRRHLGYQVSGTTAVVTDDQDTVYLTFGMVTMSLHRRLGTLSAPEEVQVVRYLTALATLEQGVVNAADNLDTDQAAIWYRNKNEVGDRTALFESWRRRLASFLGCPPGPGLSGAMRVMRA